MTTVTYRITGTSSDIGAFEELLDADAFKDLIFRVVGARKSPELHAERVEEDITPTSSSEQTMTFTFIFNQLTMVPFRVIGRMNSRTGAEITIEIDPKTHRAVFDILT